MVPRRPGPSSTTRGAPVSSTGSPSRTPLVSSYTWMIVFSPAIWITSPMSCSVPTNWTSYIRGRSPVAVTTGPATRKISPAPFAAVSFATAFIAICSHAPIGMESLVQVDADRPLDLRAQVFFLRLPHRDHDGPGGRLEPPPHRVAEDAHVVRAQDDDPEVRDLALLPDDVVEDGEHGEGMDVGLAAGREEVRLLHGTDELPDPEGLEVLQVRREFLGEREVPKAGGEGIRVQARHLLE